MELLLNRRVVRGGTRYLVRGRGHAAANDESMLLEELALQWRIAQEGDGVRRGRPAPPGRSPGRCPKCSAPTPPLTPPPGPTLGAPCGTHRVPACGADLWLGSWDVGPAQSGCGVLVRRPVTVWSAVGAECCLSSLCCVKFARRRAGGLCFDRHASRGSAVALAGRPSWAFGPGRRGPT